MSQASLEKKPNPSTLHLLGHEQAGLHADLDAPGKSKEKMPQVRLNSN